MGSWNYNLDSWLIGQKYDCLIFLANEILYFWSLGSIPFTKSSVTSWIFPVAVNLLSCFTSKGNWEINITIPQNIPSQYQLLVDLFPPNKLKARPSRVMVGRRSLPSNNGPFLGDLREFFSGEGEYGTGSSITPCDSDDIYDPQVSPFPKNVP